MTDSDTPPPENPEAPPVDQTEEVPSAESQAESPAPDQAPRGSSSRVLNQDEIDSLLGFAGAEAGNPSESGIHALANLENVSYERLPMLEVVFDRLVRLMTTSLRNFTSDNVEVTLEKITSLRFDDYINSIPLPAMLTVFRAVEWDNHGLIVADSSLIYSIVDVLLGGRRGMASIAVDGRPYTTIERKLVERMITIVLSDLCAAFDPLSPVVFRFDRLETNPRFAMITRPSNASILAKFRIDMDDRGGCIDLLIPYATIEPIRDILLQMFMGEKFGRDSMWETHLGNELWVTDVHIQAVLDEQPLQLADVINWQVGSFLPLNATPQSEILLRCGTLPLFSAHMGSKNRHIAVQLDRSLIPLSREAQRDTNEETPCLT